MCFGKALKRLGDMQYYVHQSPVQLNDGSFVVNALPTT